MDLVQSRSRHVTAKNGGSGQCRKACKEFTRAGLVDITPSMPAGMDHYQISAQGMMLLKEIHQQNI